MLTEAQKKALEVIKRAKNQASFLSSRTQENLNWVNNQAAKALERKGLVTIKASGDGQYAYFIKDEN